MGRSKGQIPQVAIVGMGASGLAAALTLFREGFAGEMVALEKQDRVGKKLLSTGNGRCNLGNEAIAPCHYHSQNPSALAACLEEMPVEQTLAFFRESGLLCRQESGRLYPLCNQASMVLDVLRLELGQAGVQLRTGCTVQHLRWADGKFLLHLDTGEVLPARRVILATGGRAAPKLGSDGSGYGLARAMGHKVNPLYPCLVPLKGKEQVFHGLKGQRAQGRASLLAGEQLLGAETGEIQFTDYGLSGIPLFQLSCLLPQAAGRGVISLDLLPDLPLEGVLALLRERLHQGRYQTLEELLLGTVPKRVGLALLKSLGFASLAQPVAALRDREVRDIAATLKDWRMQVSGTLGWDQAQVTGGGISLEEVDPRTMESRLRPGLYLTGELLDAVGDCGGYNLHWAWNTGILAARAAGGTR